MEQSESNREKVSSQRSKVVRAITKYRLDGIGKELEQFWTEDSKDRRSLRDLADYFNRQLLKQELRKANISALDGEEENFYRLLTHEDVSSAERTRTRRYLEREGIDAEALQNDFVSYQSIRRYLTNTRDVQYTPDGSNRVKRTSESVQRLRSRTAKVTESNVAQLQRTNHLTLGDEVHVTVDVRLLCEDCNSQFTIAALLDRGGCNCSP